MADVNLKIVIDALNMASGELQKVQGQLNGVEEAGKKGSAGLSTAKDAFESLTGVSLTGVGALMAVGGALKYSIDQAAEMQQIMAQTEAVIRSTGGAAGMTAQDVSDLSSALAENSTFADDAVQKGANLLLTFTNIGADVFPLATQAMLDMATAMGTDASGGAIQLGKALNDPTEGVSALTRVGVTFTEEQKQLIKSLQETGDVAGAQKIILAELNKEFGGSAAAQVDTYAGQMKQLQNQIDNLAESVGGALLPTLTDAATALNLLLTWSNKVQAAEDQAAESALDASASFEDYAVALADVKYNSGDLLKSERDMIVALARGEQVTDGYGNSLDDLVGSVQGLTRAEYDAEIAARVVVRATEAQADAWAAGDASLQRFVPAMQGSGKSLEQVWKDLGDAAEESKDRQKAATDSILSYWDAVFGGTLDQDVADFKQSQDDLQTEIGQTRDRIAELEGQSYLTPAQRTELESLQTKLGDLRTEYTKEAEAHGEKTKRIIFDLMVQKAAMDGVITTAEEGFITRIGTALGLFDETTATVLSEANTAWGEFNSGQISTAESRLWNIQRLLNGQTQFDWNLNVHVNSDPIPAMGDVGLKDAPVVIKPEGETVVNGMRAAGGPVLPGRAYLVGERGPELVIPRQAGTVLPAGPTAAALTGAPSVGGDTYHITINNPQAAALLAATINDRRRARLNGLMGAA